MPLALTSCGDDDNDEPEIPSVVGSWRFDNEAGSIIFNLYKNGTYNYFEEDYYEPEESFSHAGTYVVRSDGYITTTDEEGDVRTATILSISSTSMILKWPGDDDIFTFIRQK